MGEPHEVIDLSSDATGTPDTGSRSPAVLVAVAVIAALAAATLLLVPDGDPETAFEETTATSVPDRDTGPFPPALALGAPQDGKDSVGLPVRAEPSTGLVDGQTVRVTGTGFPPGQSVGVVMCAKEAGRDHGGRGAEACNLGRFAQVTSDADGVASVDFEVRPLVTLDGAEVDCASESQRCLVAMGLISDYDQSGGVLVDFDPSEPLPDPPAVTLDREGPFDDGDRVTVRVGGLRPGTPVGAMVCTADGDLCVDSVAQGTVGDGGSAAIDVSLWRVFAAPLWDAAASAREIDCAVTGCVLQLWGEAVGERSIPRVPLAFRNGHITRARPVVELRSPGPHRPGDRIELFIAGVGVGSAVEAALCDDTACAHGTVQMAGSGDGVGLTFAIPTAAEGNPCGEGPCLLHVRVVGSPDQDAPPALSPEPVEVVLGT